MTKGSGSGGSGGLLGGDREFLPDMSLSLPAPTPPPAEAMGKKSVTMATNYRRIQSCTQKQNILGFDKCFTLFLHFMYL